MNMEINSPHLTSGPLDGDRAINTSIPDSVEKINPTGENSEKRRE